MPPIKRKVLPTKQEEANREYEEDEDATEEEETESVNTTDDAVYEPEELETDDEESEETDNDEVVGLPDITEPIGEPGEGFDFFGKVHSDLKAAGYVANKADTKALIKYFHQVQFFDAFENGRHDIAGLGFVYSETKPAKTMKATSDFGGKTKGEEYTVPAKHTFGFKVTGSAKSRLAEISTIAGWEPESFLGEDEAEDEE